MMSRGRRLFLDRHPDARDREHADQLKACQPIFGHLQKGNQEAVSFRDQLGAVSRPLARNAVRIAGCDPLRDPLLYSTLFRNEPPTH